jgi:hypothetical protein
MTDTNTEAEISPKATPTKKTSVKKTTVNTSILTNIENETAHYKMIQDAAYFIAEHHNFTGDPQSFWLEAEMQISDSLSH